VTGVWHFEERHTGTASIIRAMRDHAAHMDKLYVHGEPSWLMRC
jgi:hypothetical protein